MYESVVSMVSGCVDAPKEVMHFAAHALVELGTYLFYAGFEDEAAGVLYDALEFYGAPGGAERAMPPRGVSVSVRKLRLTKASPLNDLQKTKTGSRSEKKLSQTSRTFSNSSRKSKKSRFWWKRSRINVAIPLRSTSSMKEYNDLVKVYTILEKINK